MRTFFFEAFLLVAVDAPAETAFPPSGAMDEVGWNGPGFVCEESFTLEVTPDEYVREDAQLETWYPASITVKSPLGWYTVTHRSKRPRRAKERFLFAALPSGWLYAYPPADPKDAARFIFLPRTSGARAVEITFYKVDPSNLRYADWRIAPQNAYNPSRYGDVLARLDFSKGRPTSCLNKEREARG